MKQLPEELALLELVKSLSRLALSTGFLPNDIKAYGIMYMTTEGGPWPMGLKALGHKPKGIKVKNIPDTAGILLEALMFHLSTHIDTEGPIVGSIHFQQNEGALLWQRIIKFLTDKDPNIRKELFIPKEIRESGRKQLQKK